MGKILRRLLCLIGRHPEWFNGDASGMWRECVFCERRRGFVPRDALIRRDRDGRKRLGAGR
jgi:hypothetical protein